MDENSEVLNKEDVIDGISVVIPVYNNEDTIASLCQLLSTYLLEIGKNFEIIMVNDGSVDNSLKIMHEIQKSNTNVVIVNNQLCYGQHKAILEGISKSRASLLIVMDADLQDDPSVIVPLFSHLNKGYDAVFVKRKGQYQSFGRMSTSRLFKSVVYYFTGLAREAGTYFITTRAVGKSILNYNCPHPFTTIMVAAEAKKLGYINGIRSQRIHGQSAYSFAKRIRYAYYAMECIFYIYFLKNKVKSRK